MHDIVDIQLLVDQHSIPDKMMGVLKRGGKANIADLIHEANACGYQCTLVITPWAGEPSHVC